MLDPKDDRAWFAPKRFGYGAGLPIAWQGWVLMGSYLLAIAGIALLDSTGRSGARISALTLFVIATALLFVISARHTRGGWKWRWGKD
jgi:uncharacterized membrane protein